MVTHKDRYFVESVSVFMQMGNPYSVPVPFLLGDWSGPIHLGRIPIEDSGIHGGIGGKEMVVLWLCRWSLAVIATPETNLVAAEIPKAETSLVQGRPLSILRQPLIGLMANQNATQAAANAERR
jgi:hypothetical protein